MKLDQVRAMGLLCLLSGSVVATGCGSDAPSEPSDPHEQVDSVGAALEAPSGTVDAEAVAEVFAAEEQIMSLQPLLEGLVLAASGSATCSTGGATGGEVDLSCATDGMASGSATFTVQGSMSGESVDSLIVFEFTDACVDAQCASGTASIEAHVDGASVSSTIAYSLDVANGSTTTHLFFGIDASVTSQSVLSRIAIFTGDDQSFVLDASVTDAGAGFSIEGANGSWSCEVTDAGGTCSGATEITF